MQKLVTFDTAPSFPCPNLHPHRDLALFKIRLGFLLSFPLCWDGSWPRTPWISRRFGLDAGSYALTGLERVNQVIERRADAVMSRTQNRPCPLVAPVNRALVWAPWPLGGLASLFSLNP